MEIAPILTSSDEDTSGNILTSIGIEDGAFTYNFVFYDDITFPVEQRDNFLQILFNEYGNDIETMLPTFEGHSLAQDMIDTSMSLQIRHLTLADGETYTVTFSPDDIASFLNSAK